MNRIKKSKKQEQSNKIDEKLSQEFIDITNLMYEKLDGGHKKTTVLELFGDLELRNQFYRMKEIASLFIKEKMCVWCKRDIKVNKLNPIDKLTYLESAICPQCEEENYRFKKNEPREDQLTEAMKNIVKKYEELK